MTAERRTVRTLVEGLRDRRSMYLRPGEGVAAFQMYVLGYEAALSYHGILEDVPAFRHFGEWLYVTRRWSQSMGWAWAIEQHTPEGMDPVDHFVALAMEYLTLKLVLVAEAIQGDSAKFSLYQYAPAPLHFVVRSKGEQFEISAIFFGNDDRVWATTLETALDTARAEYGVSRRSWTFRSGANGPGVRPRRRKRDAAGGTGSGTT